MYSFVKKDKSERELSYLLILPILLWRMLHNQIWISLSRYWTGKFKNSIIDKGLEFEQVDRERNWDDQILLNGILFYLGSGIKAFGTSHLPLCRIDGILTTVLIHAGPVEFLYYWFHRALHHHYLYSRYHSHHHSSIVTEPITAVIHPFAEHIIYFMLFAIPMVATLLAGTASIVSIAGYLTYVDFMNNLGHCNYELIPKWVFSLFPPLKYLMYTPSTQDLFPMMAPSLGLNFMAKLKSKYFLQSQKKSISSLIEDAILDAEERGAKVLSLGLLNQAAHTSAKLLGLHSMLQGEEFNRYGEVYVERNPKLNVKIVDGSSLAVAVVLNSIPKGTTQVVLRGKLTKVAYGLAFTLCQRGIQVVTLHEHEYLKLKKWLNNESESNLVLSRNYAQKIWLVGDGLYEEEQQKAQKGTLFIPFSHFPPKQLRKDCSYHSTPAMVIPKSLENLHSCENWLPRRVMSAWRIAAIVHALEGWNEHECGLYTMSDVEKVWQASLGHGFQPLVFPTQSK
ncbi:Protein ECERIFERUM 1 [Morella rubra]|uniref:Protein ECERIFERUM 1 n=1 Tax=Morella rubra TaxID=262757 RepID=A0A6A1UWK8_9ROSI|nr:Protein ECERIFERUM 1 [Morella rubra]